MRPSLVPCDNAGRISSNAEMRMTGGVSWVAGREEKDRGGRIPYERAYAGRRSRRCRAAVDETS